MMTVAKMKPDQEAAFALDYGSSRSSLSPEAQIVYDQLVEERQRAQQERESLIAATTWFPDLGVGVRDGNVYQHMRGIKLLGLLAGAHAEAVAGNAGKRRSASERAVAVALVGPVGAVSRAYRGVAAVVFADGSSSEKMLTDLASVARAQAQAGQFNALAASTQPAVSVAAHERSYPAHDGLGVVSELERLATLHSTGALDDEEFRAAKARIIRG
jgi:hypothetical protein